MDFFLVKVEYFQDSSKSGWKLGRDSNLDPPDEYLGVEILMGEREMWSNFSTRLRFFIRTSGSVDMSHLRQVEPWTAEPTNQVSSSSVMSNVMSV